MADREGPLSAEEKAHINASPHITFTIPLQVILEREDFDPRNHLRVHLIRDDVIAAATEAFDREVETIRCELNEADPMVIRPPFEFNSQRLIQADLGGVSIAADNGEEH